MLTIFHKLGLAIAMIAVASVASGRDTGPEQNSEAPRPPILEHAGFEQKLGAALPLDLEFRDEAGATVKLGDFVGKRPVILVLAYYRCPMLCTLVLNGVGLTAHGLPFVLGKDYDIVTVSFDPTDTFDVAAKKKATYLKEYELTAGGPGWHFLVGDEAAIRTLTGTVGFKYGYDEVSREYAHASGIMVVTAEGKLSHYFYGVDYAVKDVRLALVEASKNKIGSPVDQLMLFCYHYDPATGKYGAAVMNILRLGGALTVLALVTFFVVMMRRESRLRSMPAVSA